MIFAALSVSLYNAFKYFAYIAASGIFEIRFMVLIHEDFSEIWCMLWVDDPDSDGFRRGYRHLIAISVLYCYLTKYKSGFAADVSDSFSETGPNLTVLVVPLNY